MSCDMSHQVKASHWWW